MLYLLTVALCLLVSTFALPVQSPSSASRHIKSIGSGKPISWKTEFPSTILAKSQVKLDWQGGKGESYELYYIPTWPGAPAELEHVPIARTMSTTYKWIVPDMFTYPADTTLIVLVRDASTVASAKRSLTFDASRAMRLVDKAMYRRSLSDRRVGGWN